MFLGQHIKEFTDFLSKHTDSFQVVDDCVILIDVEGIEDVPQSERLHLPQPSIDIKATQQLLDYFAQCIESKGAILVDQLFYSVTSHFPQEQWFKMFKTPNDLTTFFKLFSDCFHIQANLVTLLQRPKLSDAYIEQAKSRARDQFNNNANVNMQSFIRTQSPIIRNNNSGVGDFKLNELVSNNQMNSGMNHQTNRSEPNSGFDSLITENEVKLENLCETNCPSSTTGSYYSKTSTPVIGAVEKTNTVNNNKNTTFKQYVDNLVKKTLAENFEKDKQSMNNLQTEPIKNQSSQNTSPVHTTNNYFVGDTWKVKVLQNTKVISNVKESQFVTDAILKSAVNNQVVLSFDCEGVNLGAKGQLTLLEIGTTKGEAFIFDVLSCPEMITEGGLKTLLESENVIKVIHDCRNDSGNLFNQFNILMKNVFDTQVSFFYFCY